MPSQTPLNNGLLHHPKQNLCHFGRCSYFFTGDKKENFLLGRYKGSKVVACKLAEKNGNLDLYITFPENTYCNHFHKAQITHRIKSTPDSHLSYHGHSKGKKESGETHLIVNGSNLLKGRANVLQAPLSRSGNLAVFPLPICRLELSESPGEITPRALVDNYFELFGQNCFFNTLDMYLARKGYMASLLDRTSLIPEIVASIFAFITLETFKVGRLIPRRGHFPQIVILQTAHFELIIIAMKEAQNAQYNENQLSYFHSRDYFQNLFNRFSIHNEHGYFVDLFETNQKTKEGFVKIMDLL